jgi:hypothetical protein
MNLDDKTVEFLKLTTQAGLLINDMPMSEQAADDAFRALRAAQGAVLTGALISKGLSSASTETINIIRGLLMRREP